MADTFKGPPQKQGIIGRLDIGRQPSSYALPVFFSIRGLSSETITIQGEASNGLLSDGPPIRYLSSNRLVDGTTIQNGDYVISVDDFDPKWTALCFTKSGSLDRLDLQFESPFEYVTAPKQNSTR